jgi:uncharacterized Zn finger protein (UPF0148 family)
MGSGPSGVAADNARDGTQALAVLCCRRCGAPLAARDAERVCCAACGEEQPVPPRHREAVRLTKQADLELERAAQTWRRLESATLSAKRTLVLTHLPPAVLTLGLAWLAVFGHQGAPFTTRTVAGLAVVFMALPPSVLIAVQAAMYGIPAAKLENIAQCLVSRGETTQECRRCGAPLSFEQRAVFARCIYCGTDSLVLLDQRRRRLHLAEVTAGQAHAADALRLMGVRARETESLSLGGAWAAGITSVTGFVGCVALESVGGFRPVLALAFFVSYLVTALYAWWTASSPHITRQLRGTLQEALMSRHGGRGAQSRPAVQLLVWGIAVSLLQLFAWFGFLFTDLPRGAAWLAAASVVPLLGWIVRALTRWERGSGLP